MFSKRGSQSVLEYSLLIAVAVSVVVFMGNYLTRSMQGKLKDTADGLGGELFPGSFQAPGTAHGVESGSSNMTKSTATFSYEGGQYEGSLFTGHAQRKDTTVLNFNGE